MARVSTCGMTRRASSCEMRPVWPAAYSSARAGSSSVPGPGQAQRFDDGGAGHLVVRLAGDPLDDDAEQAVADVRVLEVLVAARTRRPRCVRTPAPARGRGRGARSCQKSPSDESRMMPAWWPSSSRTVIAAAGRAGGRAPGRARRRVVQPQLAALDELHDRTVAVNVLEWEATRNRCAGRQRRRRRPRRPRRSRRTSTSSSPERTATCTPGTRRCAACASTHDRR